VTTDTGGELVELFSSTRRNDHLRTLLCETLGNAPTDPTRGAEHDCNLVLKQTIPGIVSP
jgi:hypothetical protein